MEQSYPEEGDVDAEGCWNNLGAMDSAQSSHAGSPTTSSTCSSQSTPSTSRSESPSPNSKHTSVFNLLHAPCNYAARISRNADFTRSTYYGDGFSSIGEDNEPTKCAKYSFTLLCEFDLEACAASNEVLYAFEHQNSHPARSPTGPQPIVLCTSVTGTISFLHGRPHDKADVDEKLLLDIFQQRIGRQMSMTEATWLGATPKSLMPWRHIATDSRGRLIDCKTNRLAP